MTGLDAIDCASFERTRMIRGRQAMVAGAVIIVLTTIGVVTCGLVPVRVSRVVADLTGLLGAVAASAGFVASGLRAEGRERAWRLLLAGGSGVWALGQALWSWQRTIDHRAMTFPDPADVCFLVLPVLSFVALLVVSRGDRDRVVHTRRALLPRAALILDGVIIVSSVLALTWETSLSAIVGRPNIGSLLLADSYAVADLVLITIALLFAATWRSVWRVPFAWLILGLIAIGFSDTVYAFAISSNIAVPPFSDVGYMSGPVFLVIAALVPDCHIGYRKPHVALWSLPYVPLIAVCGYVVATTALRGEPDPVEVYILGGVLTLVVLRQMLTQRQVFRAHLRVTHQATHDPLTGLANRVLFMEHLDDALSRTRRDRHRVGLVYLDLDSLKELNDAWGHGIGDVVLCAVAQRLRCCVRKTDTLARVGGDEFVILLDPVPESPERVKQRLTREVGQPLAVRESYAGPAETHYEPSMSIGYVTLDPTDTAERAISRADSTMYDTKRTKNQTEAVEESQQISLL